MKNEKEIKYSEYQQKFFDFIDNGVGNAVVAARAGSGKCLGKDTEVLMYDGTLKKVQDIVVGDKLMGDDSTARTVLSTTKGIGNLKKIIPKKGQEWVCNDVHILTLDKYRSGWKTRKSEHIIVDVPVNKLENGIGINNNRHKDGTFRVFKLIKTGVDFKEYPLDFDPWLYGLWLGDGTRGEASITNVDKEIHEKIPLVLPSNLISEIHCYGSKSPKIVIKSINGGKRNTNGFRQFVRKESVNDNNEKIINKKYLINSRKNRLKLLAGIIDSDGYYRNCNYYIATKFETLRDDILFLARSLGFGAYAVKRNKTCCNTNVTKPYYYITINGNIEEIPVVLKRKKATPRKIQKNPLHVGFKIVDHGIGDYYGFTLDGNGRFLLSDFTITHNTTTIIEAIKRINPKQKCIFLAFNRAISEELTEKLKNQKNASVRTSHSLGLLMLKRNFGNKIEINDYKYRTYIKSNISSLTSVSDIITNKKQLNDYLDSILQLINFARLNYCQSIKEIDNIANKYSIPIQYDECDVVLKVMKWGKENTQMIDYIDMIWLPVELSLKPLGLQYDWVFVDECQDQSIISIELFKKCFKRGTRFVCVGDQKQCQPVGTKVLMNDGTIKNIEDIKINDKVVTYVGNRTCRFKGYQCSNGKPNQYASRVTAIERHQHQGNIITLYTKNGNKTSYTPDHLCYAKFNREKCIGKYILYLMCNEQNMWRIGITNLFNNSKTNQGFGLSARMRSEKCNKGWILDVFNDEKSARFAEIIYSMVYKIPQIIFRQYRAGCKTISDEDVEEYYQELNKHYNIEKQAIKLLNYFNRDIRYPFFIVYKDDSTTIGGNKYRNGRDYLSNYYACNLLKDVMDVPFYSETNHRIRTHGKCVRKEKHRIPIYDNIIDVSVNNEIIDVISLNVENEHNYIADNILTHNCINTFAGASDEAFNMICNMPNTKIFELPISYRCDKKIIKLANEIVPDIVAREDAGDGEILYNCHTSVLQEGDMVLCRSKAPLVKLYTRLLQKKINCYINGQDIGSKLIKIIEPIDKVELNSNLNKDGVFLRLYQKLFNDRNKLMQKRGMDFDDATTSSSIMEQYDNINTLLTLSANINNKYELIEHIKSIFKEEQEGICLSTVHKSKGLEADNVYIICHSTMPSKLAQLDWEKKQEENLLYVAYTRAKHRLGFISEKEISPCGSSQEPMEIINDLMYIENKICKVLGTEPTVRMNSVDIAKFNLKNATDIKDNPIGIEIHTIDPKTVDFDINLLERLNSIIDKHKDEYYDEDDYI